MFRCVLPLLVAICFTAARAEAATIFTATLTGDQEETPTGSTATGTGSFELNDAMTALTYDITIDGLDFTGDQTMATEDDLLAAHFHQAPPGTSGGVVFGFFGMPFNDDNPNDVVVTPFAVGVGGTIIGKWDEPEGNSTTLTDQLAALLAGNLYVNFHTTEFPGGEIRGQVLQVTSVPEPAMLTLLALGALGLARAKRR